MSRVVHRHDLERRPAAINHRKARPLADAIDHVGKRGAETFSVDRHVHRIPLWLTQVNHDPMGSSRTRPDRPVERTSASRESPPRHGSAAISPYCWMQIDAKGRRAIERDTR